ncbi:MAG: hypothetical protein M3Z64_01545 [Verrucomicrobiota bacterium]|nr:hypothetical protein [Verrucomicrobiota bacterium]
MRILVCAALFAVLVSTAWAAEPLPSVPPEAAANAEKYGQYPLGYKAIIKDWLSRRLIDASSAVTEFVTEPKLAEMKGKDGEQLFGYFVEFRVNSRNQFGAFTGMQKKGALIFNGEVIKSTGFSF